LPRIDSKFNKDKRLEPVPEVPEPDNKASSDNFANTQPTPLDGEKFLPQESNDEGRPSLLRTSENSQIR